MKKYSTENWTSIWAAGVIAAGLLASSPVTAADNSMNRATANGSVQNSSPTTAGQENKLSSRDAHFLKAASTGNLAEVALAEIAERQAQHPQIKQFAQMMVQDHQQAQQKLREIAQAHGVQLDQSLSRKQSKEEKQLQKLSGEQFDKEYAQLMLKDHAKDIQEFQKAEQRLQASDLKQYAQSTLPALHKHLQHAENAAKAVGVNENTIASLTRGVDQNQAVGGTGDQQQQQSGGATNRP